MGGFRLSAYRLQKNAVKFIVTHFLNYRAEFIIGIDVLEMKADIVRADIRKALLSGVETARRCPGQHEAESGFCRLRLYTRLASWK
jgi:hypothetical protein